MVHQSLAGLTDVGAFIVTENARRLSAVIEAVEQKRPDLITRIFVATKAQIDRSRVVPELFELPVIRDFETPLSDVPLHQAS